ncbi:MAG: RNA polymerase sigma factor, partial [Porcipelethomonas sp.]
MSKNTVRVYDTITKKYVEIEVSERVRTYYNRTQWNIDDNDESFYKHEIQFSALKGSNDEGFENFHEFRTEYDSVEKQAIRQEEYARIYKCLADLSNDERALIITIYFEGKTEKEYAEMLHTSQQNIHKKKC